jgi:hypothetical protein
MGTSTTALPTDSLERLATLVRQQGELERAIAVAEDALDDLKSRHRRVSEEDVPGLLDEVGLSDVRLADGTKVSIKETLRASVAADGKYTPFILGWLDREGHGDLVKNDVIVSFGRGEDAAAVALVAALTERGLAPARKKTVNNQSFTALLRELMEAGEEVPLDEMGVAVQRRSVLKRSE